MAAKRADETYMPDGLRILDGHHLAHSSRKVASNLRRGFLKSQEGFDPLIFIVNIGRPGDKSKE
jgi:hypothetical protein